MYKATVNQEYTLEVKSEDNRQVVDGSPVDFDCKLLPDGTYHILLNHVSMVASIIDVDRNAKRVLLNIEGKPIEVVVEDDFDMLLSKMGMDKSAAQKVSEVKSPMPGLVLEVTVKPGDTVVQGGALMVLEAMKMENVISSPCDAVIASVEVAQQDKVDKNQVLVKFEA